MSDMRHRFIGIARSITNHWTTAISLTAAMFGIVETTFYWFSGLMGPYMLPWAVAQISTSVAMAKRPRAGAWATGIIWAICILSPQPVLNSGLFATLCALAILAYNKLSYSIILCLVDSLSLSVFIGKEHTLPWSTIFNILTLFISAITLGQILKWHTEILSNRLQQDKERKDRMLASQIHSDIANGLSATILQLQTGSQPTETICTELKETLQRVHNVINLLETQQPMITDDDTDSIVDMQANIEQLSTHNDGILHSLNISGSTIFPTQSVHMTRMNATLAKELLKETYSNIAKHSDPARGYIVCIHPESNELRISASNIAGNHQEELSGKYGLKNLSKAIEDSGGILDYGYSTNNPTEWNLFAKIPYR
ncbi:hypothetical protein JS528_06500 [Bifidobacterium sp. MA2]|uniref:Histidine kinase n=1 Tax=Bifidobacterium santillanense TaxID=2809028 RepID=A0ABS5UQ67_9BIFI|nr:hypothetical protein [Bifidobacterium santillanense]MBT1173011.1 hypothetical protein [Bifidobacterium santillanense]